ALPQDADGGARRLAALGLVGGVGRLDLLADALPVGLAISHHLGEGAVAHDAHGAVYGDHLAVDIFDLFAHQEGRHVGELAGAADAAHRVAGVVAAVVTFLQRVQPRPGTFGRERAGCDGVQPDA